METGYVTSRDGTRIATYSTGRLNGPVVVLAHGLGGSMVAWRHFIRYFEPKYHIISWDYRGLYGSQRPRDESWSITKHCEDLEAVLEAKSVEKAIFVGWSMGVQVNLEYYRKRPEQFIGMVHINGTAGKPFATAFNSEVFQRIAPLALEILRNAAPAVGLVGPCASTVAKSRAIIALIKATGLCAPTLDEQIFSEIAGDFLRLDFDAYSRIFRALGDHDARDVLPLVKVPMLVIAGDRDLFTPLDTAREMVEKVSQAELSVIPGGTHYTPIEYPMMVLLRIEKFFRERLHLT